MRTSLTRLAAWILLISLSGAGTLVAQEEDTFDLFRPRLEIGAGASREKAFRDEEDAFIDPDSDTLDWRALNLRANIPLGGTRLDGTGRLLGHQFFAHGAIEGSSTQISFLQEDPVLYHGGLGFTALMLSQSRNLYAASLFATVAEEEDTLDSPDIRYTGLALGSVRRGSGILIYGGAFTFQLGRGLVLPVFGGWTQLSPNWSLGGAFPFLLRATYRSSLTWCGGGPRGRGDRVLAQRSRDAGGRDRRTGGPPPGLLRRRR
jgi:hypothetical protein